MNHPGPAAPRHTTGAIARGVIGRRREGLSRHGRRVRMRAPRAHRHADNPQSEDRIVTKLGCRRTTTSPTAATAMAGCKGQPTARVVPGRPACGAAADERSSTGFEPTAPPSTQTTPCTPTEVAPDDSSRGREQVPVFFAGAPPAHRLTGLGGSGLDTVRDSTRVRESESS